MCRGGKRRAMAMAVFFVAACRLQGGYAATNVAPDPQDPPFDLTKVLFSGTFSDHMVLQREPRRSAVFGTASIGATVSIVLTDPNGGRQSLGPVTVANSADPAVNGTWKVLLPSQPAGFGYALEAQCTGCLNSTSANLKDVGFGEVGAARAGVLCSCEALRFVKQA